MIYLTDIDLSKNELQNAIIQPLATAPASPKMGQIYYNSTDKMMYQYDGTAWKSVGKLYAVATTSADGLMSSSDKTKLDGIADGAEVNVQSDWTAASGDAFIKNKPTALSAFTNDENFIDNTVSNLVNYYTKTDTYTKTEVNGLISGIATITIQIVSGSTLPTTGQKSNVIYLLAKSTADGEQNAYDEYLWTGTKYERIGDTTIDLSSYLQKTGDGSSVTAAFTTAGSRANIATGESLAVIFGKIAKYFTDLKTVAFSGSYTDLTNKPTSVVKYASGTISAGAKTVDVSFTGTFVGATARDASTGEYLLVDVDVTTNKATFSINDTYTNAITVVVMYS